ncbi:MAG: 16S rRNA (cytidine(1402)-2'-O)-methyltransferase [bacterium]
MAYRDCGCLFVVSTPIGNLDDITFRAIETLKRVDLVLSESVTKTRNLLRHYSIPTPVASYRDSNADEMIPKVIAMLSDGKSVAIVAEAGTPGISDPGRRLVAEAHRAGCRVTPIPGPSSLTAAVSVAGVDVGKFLFEGFLPRQSSKRRKRLLELASQNVPLIFFEAPHRLFESLNDMYEIFGDRLCVVAREMTKIHEEIISGRLSEMIQRFKECEPRGEFVVICEGSKGSASEITSQIADEAYALVLAGYKKRQAARLISEKYGVRVRDIYQHMLFAEGRRKNES